MSNLITSAFPHRAHFPVGIVAVGERNNLFVKIQRCFFEVILSIRVTIKAVFTLFASSPAQMQTCRAQLITFKETLESCDAESRVQREQVRGAYAALPEYVKQKFVSLSPLSLTRFVESQNQLNNESSIQKFRSECCWVIDIQKLLVPVRNFFSRASDRVDPNQEAHPDPRTNPRINLNTSEKEKRVEDPFAAQIGDKHCKRAKQIAAMSTFIEVLANKNIDVRTKKLKEEGNCPMSLDTMRVPVYPFTEAYNGPLHRFDLEFYLYDGGSGPLEGDTFAMALANKKGFECTQCQKSPTGCVLAGQEPGTVLKIDTAFQKMLVEELVRTFTKITDVQIRMAFQEKQSEMQAEELGAQKTELSQNEVQQKLEDLIKDFPSGSLKQRMQNILRDL